MKTRNLFYLLIFLILTANAAAQKNILMIVGDYSEDYEVMVPFQALQMAGHEVDAVCPGKASGDFIRTSVHYFDGAQTFQESRGHDFYLNADFDNIEPGYYDALVLPGGRAPEYLRMDPRVIEIASSFMESNKPVAAVCHGPLILATAGKLKDRRCTGYSAIEPDIKASGGIYIRSDVVVDKNLVTGTAWPVHPEWLSKFIEVMGTENVAESVIIDHTCTDIDAIPQQWIEKAKEDLNIVVWTSGHGGQITQGLKALARWKGDEFDVSEQAESDALQIRGGNFEGATYVGNPDMQEWTRATKKYLQKNPKTNVVFWTWCGTVSILDPPAIDQYLHDMDALEKAYPDVHFVYMTGHLDGTGVQGKLHRNNELIRSYCRRNGKILYDFADIESFGPYGINYRIKLGTDGCNYDANGDGKTTEEGDPALPTNGDKNWALYWQSKLEKGEDWFDVDTQHIHTHPLNVNYKAYAAWWLWARIAGWKGI